MRDESRKLGKQKWNYFNNIKNNKSKQTISEKNM